MSWLLDTHIWLWWMLGDPALKPSAREFLDALGPEDRPFLCDISLWETALLVERKRLVLDIEFNEFLEKATAPAAVRLVRITPEIVIEMNRLPTSFHRDPADRLIVATARSMGLPLATCDKLIRKTKLISLPGWLKF